MYVKCLSASLLKSIGSKSLPLSLGDKKNDGGGDRTQWEKTGEQNSITCEGKGSTSTVVVHSGSKESE